MQFDNIIFEIDCKPVADSINSRRFQNTEVGDILRSCPAKLSNFQSCCVQFVSRQVNQVAHCLVRTSRSFACQHILDFSPTCIDSLVVLILTIFY